MAAVTNDTILVLYLNAYKNYLNSQKKEDTNPFTNREEDYKRGVAKAAVEALDVKSWDEAQIGSGFIGDAVIKAVGKRQNLINQNQVTSFSNKVKEDYAVSERVLFDLYHERKEEECFSQICKLFGKKYDLVSYLFFIYDPDKYLPIRSSIFDEIFVKLEIQYQTAGKCSWENYQGYIKEVTYVRDKMRVYFQNDEMDLLDAHSFLWTIQQLDSFVQPPVTPPKPEVNARVLHRQYYGEGVIVKMTDKEIYVAFDNYKGERIFPSDTFEAGKNYLELI